MSSAGHGESALTRFAARMLGTRWFVRAPIAVYRVGLGFVFGRRLLMLEHIGRVSGCRRYVVLEVIDHSSKRYVVVAGFGERAQWLRNVDANPHVRVSISTRRHALAQARRLSAEEATESLNRYASSHPRAWRKLRPVLEQTLGARLDEHHGSLPAVGIELES